MTVVNDSHLVHIVNDRRLRLVAFFENKEHRCENVEEEFI